MFEQLVFEFHISSSRVLGSLVTQTSNWQCIQIIFLCNLSINKCTNMFIVHTINIVILYNYNTKILWNNPSLRTIITSSSHWD